MTGRQSIARKTTSGTRQRLPVEAPVATLLVEEPITNPASEAKLDLLKEKEDELVEVTKIDDTSAAMTKYFTELAEGIKKLANGAQGISGTMDNWDYVFGVMSETNHGRAPESSEKWVRFNKSTFDVYSNNEDNRGRME